MTRAAAAPVNLCPSSMLVLQFLLGGRAERLGRMLEALREQVDSLPYTPETAQNTLTRLREAGLVEKVEPGWGLNRLTAQGEQLAREQRSYLEALLALDDEREESN